NGGAGNDSIAGGAGNDLLNGGTGNDLIDGGTGNDAINGGDGSDTLNGGLGNDIIDGGFGLDAMDGGLGNDTLDTRFLSLDYSLNMVTGVTNFVGETAVNFENVFTGAGNDLILGTAGANLIDSGAGDDEIEGGAGNDILIGGAGVDILLGEAGNDVLNGTRFALQGTGEVDGLISGSVDDQDTFVLGERIGGTGRVFYNDQGNSDLAVIFDFDLHNFAGDTADRIQLVGNASLYSITNVTLGSFSGAGIRVAASGDLIGLVDGVNAFDMNLAASTQFTYV
ncbi:MAG: calcium-binding protein, partial [Leptolyngbyaceae cyanobacterium]